MSDELGLDLESLLLRRGWLRALARGLVREGEVDDLLQESWLAALSARVLPRHSLAAWFSGLARNAARGLRGERALTAHEPATLADARASADDSLAQAELQERLIAAVRALREPYRTTVLLRYFEELPLEEVARRTGVPGSTARTRLSRALSELRERLGRGQDGSAWALVTALAREGGSGIPWTATEVVWMGTVTKVALATAVGAVAVAAVWRVRGDESRAAPEEPAAASVIPVPVGEPAEGGEVAEIAREPATEVQDPEPAAGPPAPSSEPARAPSSTTALELELERAAETFLTSQPDAAGVLDLVARLADEVEIVEPSIRTDVFGCTSGELVLGGMKGNFSIQQKGNFGIELAAEQAGEVFLNRNLQIHFKKSGPEGPAGGTILLSFDPECSSEAFQTLGPGELYSGWVVKVDPERGAAAEPLSMTAVGDEQDPGWKMKLGSAVNLPSLDLPWVQDTRAFERWFARLRGYGSN